KAICFRTEENLIDGLELGRLSTYCDITEVGVLMVVLLVLLGLQAGLLYGSLEHLGLPGARTLGGCWLLTLDNLCHGLFFDVFEMYDIHLGDKGEPSVFAASVIYAFRLAYDACIAVILYDLYQRYRLRAFRA